MNFYPFNIGDYAGKTRHLTWDEDMAYRRLLDVYYSNEQPLPADKRQVYRLAGAQTTKQKQAVDTVLKEFFEATATGFSNTRCDEEIAKATLKKEKARESAAKRWQGEMQSDGNANACANAMRTHSEGNAPNPNPNPNPNIDGIGTRARDPAESLEWALRKAAGWESHPAPKLAVTGPIAALLENGADLELDVLPVIRALAPKVRSPGWPYFVNAIAQARDDRIVAAKVVSQPPPSNGAHAHETNRGKPSRKAIFDRIHASIDRAERGAAAGSGRDPRDAADDAA